MAQADRDEGRRSDGLTTAEREELLQAYLAAVIDAYSRRVVGWSIADHMRAELVADALQMATSRRRPQHDAAAHSD